MGRRPVHGIPPITTYPYTGSALVYWDGGPLGFDGTIGSLGTAQPPIGNLPPRTEDGYGDDPHSFPRRDVQARSMKSDFLAGRRRDPGPLHDRRGPDPLLLERLDRPGPLSEGADEVLRLARSVPAGHVATYGDLCPHAPRFAGAVLAGLRRPQRPLAPDRPRRWHARQG